MCIFVFENESVACHYYDFRILQCVYLDWECISLNENRDVALHGSRS